MKYIFTNSHISNSLSILKLIAAGICLFSLISCDQNPRKEITRGVYFWKTSFTLSAEELNWLKQTNIEKLYLRLFDVDWNPQINSAVPIGDITITTKDVRNIEIVPVVFITNTTLKNISDSLISLLSDNIYKKIFGKFSLFKNQTIKEIQLDCDWTETTKCKYFNILKHLKQLCKENKVEITATIRLH